MGISLLFLLTGEVQSGKTRWLCQVVDDLARSGVPCAGVLAPGVWHGTEEPGRFEKRGIDNVLLPGGERVPFARRNDLAQAAGSFDPESQSARARLAWHIADEALARVNAHFEGLARAGDTPDETGAPDAPWSPSRLVVDELGRLELMEGGGLTAALALLERGPSPCFPHALAVVRPWLADTAEGLLSETWGEAVRIAAGEEARRRLFAAFGLASAIDNEYH